MNERVWLEKHFFLVIFPNFKSIERLLETLLHCKQMVCPERIGGILISELYSVVWMVNKEITFSKNHKMKQ